MNDLRQFEIPELVAFEPGEGGLPRARVTTRWSEAEIYLHGAQVTSFKMRNEPPLLFLSSQSRFTSGKAIRGGVPICFPWFGPRAGDVAHGFARVTPWEVLQVEGVAGGGARLDFALPDNEQARAWPPFRVVYSVTLTDRLQLELSVKNLANNRCLEFEECLHTYFAVADVGEITLSGLAGARYIDHAKNDSTATESEKPVAITGQTDRTYPDHTGRVEISDPQLGRIIRVEKTGSASTVVWNPWTTQVLADLGPDEYRQMICVESGNVGSNRVLVEPHQVSKMQVILSSRPYPPA
jgi:glucose-6-phosphate 1-epimerase